MRSRGEKKQNVANRLRPQSAIIDETVSLHAGRLF